MVLEVKVPYGILESYKVHFKDVIKRQLLLEYSRSCRV